MDSYDEVDSFDDEYATDDNMGEYEAMYWRSVMDVKDAFTHFSAKDILSELSVDTISKIKDALEEI